jgi:hypothetical protein
MKVNLFKILIATLAAPAVLMSCNGDDGGNDGRNSTYVPPASVAFLEKSNTVNAVGAEQYTLTVVKSSRVAATATLTSSQEIVDEYNNATGTIYTAFPADKYQISETTVEFSAEETRKTVSITWDEAEIIPLLQEAFEYVIPVMLSASDGTGVSETNDYFMLELSQIEVAFANTTLADIYPPVMAEKGESVKNTITVNVPFAEEDLTVEYKIDPALVSAYNTANASAYIAPPAGFASLSATEQILTGSSVIPAGEESVDFSVFLNHPTLFDGNKMLSGGNIVIPISITATSIDGIELVDDVMYLPVRRDKEIKGPWTVLEGAEFALPNDPTPESYNTDVNAASSLFNGKWEKEGAYETNVWASWFNTPNVFPLVFVVDMGAEHVFTKFRIVDAAAYQGQLRNYEIYIADEYDEANTEWKLAASGRRGYEWADGSIGYGGMYDFPLADGTLNFPVGRYMKFVLVNHEKPVEQWVGDFINGRCKLAEVYGIGL